VVIELVGDPRRRRGDLRAALDTSVRPPLVGDLAERGRVHAPVDGPRRRVDGDRVHERLAAMPNRNSLRPAVLAVSAPSDDDEERRTRDCGAR
jgi:hypothetical protein